MTTIAYRDGELASDGLSTSGSSVLCRQAVKIGGANGLLWGASGDCAWGKAFRDWVATGLQNGWPEPPNDRTGGFIIMPDDAVACFHVNGVEYRPGLPFFADGSGADLAIGAMQVGASASAAVAAAMAWDRNSGGRINIVRRG